jgi:hypothetical protein
MDHYTPGIAKWISRVLVPYYRETYGWSTHGTNQQIVNDKMADVHRFVRLMKRLPISGQEFDQFQQVN